MDIETIINQLGAHELADGRYRYLAPETGEQYDVTLAELQELQALMSDPDSSVRCDAYSHWCSSSPGEVVPHLTELLVPYFGALGDELASRTDSLEWDSTIPEIEAAAERLRITHQKRDLEDAFRRLLYSRDCDGRRDLIDAMITLIDRHLSPVVLCPDSGEWIEDNS